MLRTLLLITALLSGSAGAASLRACISEVDLPPFAYHQAGSPEYKGYTLDVLQLLLRSSGHQLGRLDQLPWRRCLSQLQQGQYQLALNARSGQFETDSVLASKPLYQLHYLYFYSRQRFPQGLKLQNLAELPRYRLCSLLGQGYESFGIDAQQVDSGAASYAALIGKLHNSRCDLFIEAREVIAGHLLLDPTLSSKLQDPKLDEAPLTPLANGSSLHLLINRDSGGKLGLQQAFDEELDVLRNNGTLAKMMMRYLR